MAAISDAVADPRRRAVLVGCPVDGLVGVEGGLRELMAALRRRRFDVDESRDVLVGEAATEQAIVDRLRRLIGDTQAGDAVVIVLIAHCALVDDPDPGAALGSIHIMLPSDFGCSTAEDPRLYTSPELARVLDALAAKTDNITLILDMCHAAGFVSGQDAPDAPLAVAQERRLRASVGGRIAARRAHDLESLHESTHDARRVDPFSTVVRLVASSTTEQSYPRRRDDGVSSLFSATLAEVLDAALDAALDAPMSWSEIIARVHHIVRAQQHDQWVGVEGPRDRLPFSLERAPRWRIPCHIDAGSIRIDAGAIHGVRIGDRVVVRGMSRDEPLFVGRAAEVGPLEARLAAIDRPPPSALPIDAFAVIALESPRAAVELAIDDRGRHDQGPFLALLDAHGCARALPGEDTPVAARLEVAGGRARLVELPSAELLLESDLTDLDRALARLRGGLERLLAWRERWPEVPRGATDRSGASIATMLDLSWGLFDPDGLKGPPRGLSGESVRPGDRLWIRLRPSAAMKHAQLHCDVFHVDARRDVRHETAAEAHGLVLRRAAPLPEGRTAADADLEHRVAWPQGVPTTGDHREFFLVVVSPQPLALHHLATRPRLRARGDLHLEGAPPIRTDVAWIRVELRLVP
ncbi:MAG: caspase family protein [Nannocystaceae bacterium]